MLDQLGAAVRGLVDQGGRLQRGGVVLQVVQHHFHSAGNHGQHVG